MRERLAWIHCLISIISATHFPNLMGRFLLDRVSLWDIAWHHMLERRAIKVMLICTSGQTFCLLLSLAAQTIDVKTWGHLVYWKNKAQTHRQTQGQIVTDRHPHRIVEFTTLLTSRTPHDNQWTIMLATPHATTSYLRCPTVSADNSWTIACSTTTYIMSCLVFRNK